MISNFMFLETERNGLFLCDLTGSFSVPYCIHQSVNCNCPSNAEITEIAFIFY